MKTIVGVFVFFCAVLSAVEVPLDDKLVISSLKKGIEVWIKDITPSAQVACRFVGQDPIYGKPQIYPLDCPREIFEQDFPGFLDYCDEEIQETGGSSIGLVVVGDVDSTGLQHYLAHRYDESEISNTSFEGSIQLIRNNASKGIDVLLSYPMALEEIKSDLDLKKLWVFYLIQFMTENRFKKATIDVDAMWVSPEEAKYLLPNLTTVAHGIERFWSPHQNEDRLLKSYLSAMQLIKERAFTDNELAEAKSKLMKHINRFYVSNPDEIKLAEYYASHLAAFLPCTNYEAFMKNSLELVPKIDMSDVKNVLKSSFKDDARQVVIRHPDESSLSDAKVQVVLNQFVSDAIEYIGPEKVVLDEKKDLFLQLPMTDEEQKMIQGVIQTVGETSKFRLISLRSELEEKKQKLIHIHPLRSIAAMIVDSYTKQCLAEIMDDYLKRTSFISDYTKRLDREAARDNLLMYVQGFSLMVKANPDQVRFYINNGQWEKLFRYLLKLNN